MNIIVNEWYIFAALGRLIGLGDSPSGLNEFAGYDRDSENDIRELVRTKVVPNVELFNPESKLALQWTLRYYLTTRTLDWSDIFLSNYMPISVPTYDPLRFFELLYEEVYGSSDFKLSDVEGFVESNDPSVTKRVVGKYH
jgi:hypothetical protein